MKDVKHYGLAGITLLAILAIAGCKGKPVDTESQTAPHDTRSLPVAGDLVVATVNGRQIGEQLLEAYIEQRNASFPAQHNSLTREQMLDEMINLELIVQDSLHKNLDKKPDVATQLAIQKRSVLASAAFREYIDTHPLTDEEMRADYESRMDKLALREYKLRHILVNDEAEANKILEELSTAKADFISVAKKHSSGPSAESGGDLGWMGPHDMLPEFMTATRDLEKGQFTKSPVQTRFGWHIIYVEDIRDTPPPPYEQVRDRVAEVLKRGQINNYFAELREKADIEIIPGQPPAAAAEKPAEVNTDNTLRNY